jgi:transcriptional regulator with XRE-family HTH domain
MLELAVITGRQLKAVRALIGWEQTDLAKKAGVAISTVRRMESFPGEIGARTATLSLVQRALERAGIEFLNDDQPGLRLSLTQALAGVLTGLESDRGAYIWIAGGLVTMATGIACWIPSHRATRTDPIAALRQE